MAIALMKIGYGSMVSKDKIITIVESDSSPVKRLIREAKMRGRLIDATYGRKTKTVIITDSCIILCAVQTKNLRQKEVQKYV